MGLTEILAAIKTKLHTSAISTGKGHIEEIEVLGRCLGSSSEIIGETGLYLQRMKETDPAAFRIIEEDVNTYLNFCRTHYGMF